jgi:diguanylate cyclase (GGDEF)-like protein
LENRHELAEFDAHRGPRVADRWAADEAAVRRTREIAAGALPLKPRRLNHVVGAVLCADLLATVSELYQGEWWNASALVATAALLVASLWLSRRGRTNAAAALGVGTLTVSMSYLVWHNLGLRDEAVLAYPGVLIVASMFVTRRFYLAILALIVGVLCAVMLANLGGWHAAPAPPADIYTLLLVLAILLTTAYYVWLVASDLRLAMAHLATENERIRESHARIDVLAHHDSVTGLPNRVLARDRFEQAVALAQRSGHRVALVFVDLDDFKTVNDSQGHASGDLLLAQVAERLARVVRASDTVSRQGGDEFLIVLGGLGDDQAASTTAVKIIEAVSAPFEVNGLEVSLTCSLGIALYPDHGTDFDTLMKNADMAMYRAKDAGRNTFRFYDAQMLGEVVETLHLLAGIRSALARGEFFLHYQPQYELKSGRIIGAEALIRWQHPELGLVAPGRFIPIAERSGLINAIGAWVLLQACRQAEQWRRDGLDDLVVSVNVSPVQFRRDEIEREVNDALNAADLAPHGIELELTESLLIDESAHLVPLLGRLRARGVRFSIDDFGTGYSNLGYLRRFEVERLKIDQSFVRHLTQDANAERIVHAIIEMAHILNLELVAEGIEDRQTLDRLVELGCEFGQGYYWSPAVAPGEFVDLYRSNRGSTGAPSGS